MNEVKEPNRLDADRTPAEMERAVNLFILAAAEWFQSAAEEGKRRGDAWGPEQSRPARRRAAAAKARTAPKPEQSPR